VGAEAASGIGWAAGGVFGAGSFLGFVLFLPVRLAFFFALFLAFLLAGNHSHRPNVEPVAVIKLP
jgi:uncharacterized protein (DUF2062 family)